MGSEDSYDKAMRLAAAEMLENKAQATAQQVLAEYQEFLPGYRTMVMKQLSATFKDRVDPKLAEAEQYKQVKKLVQEAMSASTGHELEFWKKYKVCGNAGCEVLASVACEILSIQATSASPERVFSKSGYVIRKQRARLGDSMGCALIKAALNMSILDE